MSAGSKIIQVRMTEDLLDGILAAMVAANKTTKEAPYLVSSWIRKACQEKLDHLGRKRKP